ncbi:DUF2931 family protein [Pedobacter metabolipauper]|uniref:DUF2931 family protein n=1 Tax=Pedobacter metabolipauper TaxID=425513 RepID=A0A4V3D1K0_9SPHI|nr:DUF2931 family protein [Pedobacter metabolipauper]TDQ11393.1 Protein of unknown function (DUF2931) [Pedobacter metabolipauper]
MQNSAKKIKILGIAVALVAVVAALVYLFKPKATHAENFKWGTAVSDRYLEPVHVLAANFILPDGVSVGASDFGAEIDMPVSGEWSVGNGSMGSDPCPLPEKLYVDWLSLSERLWYKGVFKLPVEEINTIYEQLKGKQLILGLAAKGGVVLWINGTAGKKQVASFKANAYQPNWEGMYPNGKETEDEFIDRVYAKLDAGERNELDFRQSLNNQKPVNGIFTGIYEFITAQEVDGQLMMIARKYKDTLGLMTAPELVSGLVQGDRIRLSWKSNIYTPSGDTSSTPKQHELAISTKLVKKGKLAKLMKKGMPKLTASYHSERLTEEGKDLFYRVLKYYLANSTDLLIRNSVDKYHDPLVYEVNDFEINGDSFYEIVIFPDLPKPQYMKKVYYHSRHLFNFLELHELNY